MEERGKVMPREDRPVTLLSGQAAADIATAAYDAFNKHGPLTTDPVRACAILGRECAEAMDEALLLTLPADRFRDLTHQVTSERVTIDKLYTELAQVAATAMLIMENLRGRYGK